MRQLTKKKIAHKKREPSKMRLGTKKSYNRAVQVIIELNEKIVAGEDHEDDLLWDELAQLRSQLTNDQDAVISRLTYTLTLSEREIELDEATPDRS